MAFYNVSFFKIGNTIINILFYFINIYIFLDLIAYFYFAKKNKYLNLVFIKLIQFLFNYFYLLYNIKFLSNLIINFILFSIE